MRNLAILLSLLFFCDVCSSADDVISCDLSDVSTISFSGENSDDKLTIKISGPDCKNASVFIGIVDSTGKNIYQIVRPLGSYKANDVTFPIEKVGPGLAGYLMNNSIRKKSSALPVWLPYVEYISKYNCQLLIAEEAYELLRRQDILIVDVPLMFESWERIYFDSTYGVAMRFAECSS